MYDINWLLSYKFLSNIYIPSSPKMIPKETSPLAIFFSKSIYFRFYLIFLSCLLRLRCHFILLSSKINNMLPFPPQSMLQGRAQASPSGVFRYWYTPHRKIPSSPRFSVATLFPFVARFTRVRIEDSSRNRFTSSAYFAKSGTFRGEFSGGGEYFGHLIFCPESCA